MGLAALIAAYHQAAEPGTLRATLPLAGRTVVERQARLAVAAGASPVVILVERMPPALSAAIDRLRRDRLPIKVARGAEEAAAAVDPADRLLLLGDGAVVPGTELGRLAAGEGAAILTVPDSGHDERYERIDAGSRWAGLAVLEGGLLVDTAAKLGEWDLQSTLLRRALQGRARHVAAEGPVAILDSEGDLGELERRIVAASENAGGGWASRLLAPFERAITAALMASGIGAALIGTIAATLVGLGALAFAYGQLWPGLFLILLATPLDGVAERLARLRLQDGVGRAWWWHLLPILAGAALLALGYALVPVHGWGMVLLVITTLAFLIALGIEGEGRRLPGALFFAEPKGMAWLLLPFAVMDLWYGGLAFLFVYAAGSFFWAQHQAHAAVPPAAQD